MADFFTRKGAGTIRVEGPFILTRSRLIQKKMMDYLEQGKIVSIRVDFTKTSFIDGASMRMLLRLFKKVGEGHFTVIGVKPAVFASLHALHLDELWHIPMPKQEEELY